MRALASERREDDYYYPIRIDYDSSLLNLKTTSSNKKYANERHNGGFGGSVHSIHSVHTPPEACVTNKSTTANCTLRRNNNNTSCHNQYYNSVPIRKSHQMRSSESLGKQKK